MAYDAGWARRRAGRELGQGLCLGPKVGREARLASGFRPRKRGRLFLFLPMVFLYLLNLFGPTIKQ